jgi:predicted nucleic acid-binding protein
VALLIPEPLSDRASQFVQASADSLIISNLSTAEFASAVSRRVRMGEFTLGDGQTALSSLDDWILQGVRRVNIAARDVALAASFLRRLDLPLRTPDAIHTAIVRRLDATLVTFDQGMAAAARTLGIAVAEV